VSFGVAASRQSAANLLCVLWLAAAGLSAIAAAPDIDSISPLGIRPGAPTEIVLTGSDLAESDQLWTSFPASVERVGERHFRITADAAVGTGVLRTYGSNGVSNPAFILMDDLATIAGAKTNNTLASAHSITFGSAVDGVCPELNYAWFKVALKKGQRISLEVVASRIGSKLDSVLRVVNAAGRELARNDDAPGLSGDSYVSLTAPESGDYFVELRDVNYGGGTSFFYRLRVGDFPLVTAAFPAMAGQGSTTLFQLAGPGGEAGRMKAKALTNSSVVRLAIKGHEGSAFARAIPRLTKEIVEKEPNDTRANLFSIADGINGRFDKAQDRDLYEFASRKGERVEFRAATRSLGSACDAMLTLESVDGKRLGRSNPSMADEGVLAYSFPSNGTYRLVVEEAAGAFGPHLVYHIAAEQGGLALSLETEHVSAPPGKTFDLKVIAGRGEFKGAITLAVDGPAGPLAITNNVIAEGKSNVTVKVMVPESLAPGTLHELTVSGSAKRDGKEVHARASTAPAWRRPLPLMLYPPPEFEGVLVLGVTTAK